MLLKVFSSTIALFTGIGLSNSVVAAKELVFSQSRQYSTFKFIPEKIQDFVRFKQIALSSKIDSTHFWDWDHGELSISQDLMRFLLEAEWPAIQGRNLNFILRSLKEKYGLNFRSVGMANALFVPDDELYSGGPQWAFSNSGKTIWQRPGKAGIDIGIEKVWDKFDGDDSLVIAIIDAGFNFHHPELKGRNWINMAESRGKPKVDDDKNGFVDDSLGWDFVDSDNFPDDYHGHGTYCSSVIAAKFDNVKGVAGMVPRCRIMPIRVLDASGHGSQDDIAKGMLYAIANGADVINFSISGRDDNEAMRSAFQKANDKGIPVVVAAGNDGINLDSNSIFPAAYQFENIIVVGAHNHAGQLSSFSNRGNSAVDLAAPGEAILVAGLPDAKEIWREGFESSSLVDWNVKGYSLSMVEPILEKQSLVWNSGSSVTMTSANYIDLSKQVGSVLKMQLVFQPANGTDILLVEGNAEGTSTWKEIGFIDYQTNGGLVFSFALKNFDGKRFKLRFRNSITGSSSGRVLKLDGLIIKARNLNPIDESVFRMVNGTSIAAAHVSGYIGLQTLACARMGIPWSRILALEGVVQEPAFADKVLTGGRLNVYQGLRFYLSTIPELQVMDSTVLSWNIGENLQYVLNLVPQSVNIYRFSVFGLGPTTIVDGAGKISYTAQENDLGIKRITVQAEGSTILRKHLELNFTQAIPVAIQPNAFQDQGKTLKWRIGRHIFLMERPHVGSRHWIQISGVDATGRLTVLKKGWMGAQEIGESMVLNPKWSNVAQIEVRLDGNILPEMD